MQSNGGNIGKEAARRGSMDIITENRQSAAYFMWMCASISATERQRASTD